MKYPSLLVPILLLIILLAYSLIRGFQVLRTVSFSVAVVYVVVLLSLTASFFIGLVWGADMPSWLGKGISLFGYSFLVIIPYLIFSFLLVDVFRLINYFAHFASSGLTEQIRLYGFFISLVIIAVAMIVGNYKFKHPEIVNMTIEVPNSDKGKSLKIVLASDLHLGVTIDKQLLRKYVHLINEQHPDIVLFAGDVVDRQIEPLIDQRMDEELSQIESTFGTYAISGNHEYFSADYKSAEIFLESAGIVYLRDTAVLIDDSFYVIGRDDRSNKRRKPLSQLLTALDGDKIRILLDHQPYKLEEAQKNNIDLQLSGHTHDGQFFPINLIVHRMYEQGHGYWRKGNTHYYVSSGLGIWGPQYRIGTQSELVVINFVY